MTGQVVLGDGDGRNRDQMVQRARIGAFALPE